MYVVHIIPVGKTALQESYSYFSSIEFKKGDVLNIPIRNSLIRGIVIEATPASTLKTVLRAATFALRKIPVQEQVERLSPSFLALVEAVSRYEAIHIGPALSVLLPKTGSLILACQRKLNQRLEDTSPPPRPQLLQSPAVDRFIAYKGTIRESFAEKKSVLFVVPTIEDAERAREYLSHGIEQYTHIVHSNMRVVALRATEKAIAESEHPLLIIATPLQAFIERDDIGLTIIERSRAHGYRSMTRPYINLKEALLTHASLTKRNVIVADTFPTVTDEYYLRAGRYSAPDTHPKRLKLPGVLKVILQKKDYDGVEPFRILSPQLIELIEGAVAQRERVFLFAARRGLAPVVGCVDCGYILRDPESGAPLALHKTMIHGTEERWLISSISGYKEKARDVCPHCGGWRLRERGIGIQYVDAELRKLLPHTPVLLFDHTTASTHPKAEKLKEIFYNLHGQIMLGTSLALPYLEKPLGLSSIISMDSLLSIPSWRQQEEAFSIVLALREKTEGPVILQIRNHNDENFIARATRGDTAAFYDEELAIREQYKYPPYAVFIHFAFQGSPAALQKTEGELQNLFADYDIALYGAPPEDNHKIMRQGLIKVPLTDWPNNDLLARIRSLTPAIRVEINPDRIV